MIKKKRKVTSKKKIKNANPEEYFILVTGVPIKNIKELANSFATMNDWVFNHHVNESRNDFSKWIHDIFKDDELVNQLAHTNNIREMEIKIYKHIVNKYC